MTAPPRMAGWAALTPTGPRVAELAAQGGPNPDSAAEPFLSRHTVPTHVAHILVQLGARSRTEIVAGALRRQPPSMSGSRGGSSLTVVPR